MGTQRIPDPDCPFTTAPQRLHDSWQDFVESNSFPAVYRVLADYDKVVRHRDLGEVNLGALACACSQAVGTEWKVPIITLLGYGSFNAAFRVTFPDGTEVVARLPYLNARSRGLVASQVASMAYARCRLGIPTPSVFAWHDGEDNPVGAPYVITELVKGVPMNVIWRNLNWERKFRVLTLFAQQHAKFARPVPFQSPGSLYFSDDLLSGAIPSLRDERAYVIGPLVRQKLWLSIHVDWPPETFTDLRSLWKRAFKTEYDAMVKRWGLSDDPNGRSAFAFEPDDDIFRALLFVDVTHDELHSIACALEQLISTVPLPSDSSSMSFSLVHPDLAFRNVIMNTRGTKILSILDWDGASVMPFEFLPRYPQDVLGTDLKYLGISSSSSDECLLDGQAAVSHMESALLSLQSLSPGVFAENYNDDYLEEPLRDVIKAEVAYFREVYVWLLRSWVPDFDVTSWRSDASDARQIHSLIVRGFPEWFRRRAWLHAQIQGPRSSPGPETSSGNV